MNDFSVIQYLVRRGITNSTTLIDIGCGIGKKSHAFEPERDFTQEWLSLVGGPVIAFDPLNNSSFGDKHAKDERVTFHKSAISNASGGHLLVVPQDNPFHSFLWKADRESWVKEMDQLQFPCSFVRILTTALDSLSTPEDLFLKIRIPVGVREILEGASDTLRKTKFVFVEEPEVLPGPDEWREILSDAGFTEVEMGRASLWVCQ